MGRNGRAYWSAQDEIEFLNSLGTGRWTRVTTSTRKELLQKYINIITLRTEDWVPTAYAHALKLLKNE